MTVPWDVLVASAEIEDRRGLMHILQAQELEPICCSAIRESIEILQKQTVGLVFCDKNLSDGTYRDLLSAIRSLKTKVRVVVTSRHADWDEYLEAMRLGAFDVIAAPCRPTDVEWMVIQAKRDERNRPRKAAATEPVIASFRRASAGSAS